MTLSVGGGQAGQGYPCALVPIRKNERNRMGSRIPSPERIESTGNRVSGRKSSNNQEWGCGRCTDKEDELSEENRTSHGELSSGEL